MKTVITIITAATLLVGCAIPQQIKVTRQAVDAGRIQEMDKETKFQFSYTIPFGMTGIHSGPYSSLDNLNIKVESGVYIGKNATFFIGKSRETNEWEVFSVMVEEDGKWRAIPLRPNGKE